MFQPTQKVPLYLPLYQSYFLLCFPQVLQLAVTFILLIFSESKTKRNILTPPLFYLGSGGEERPGVQAVWSCKNSYCLWIGWIPTSLGSSDCAFLAPSYVALHDYFKLNCFPFPTTHIKMQEIVFHHETSHKTKTDPFQVQILFKLKIISYPQETMMTFLPKTAI